MWPKTHKVWYKLNNTATHFQTSALFSTVTLWKCSLAHRQLTFSPGHACAYLTTNTAPVYIYLRQVTEGVDFAD